MDEAAETEVGGEGGIDGGVGRAEAKHELPGTEAALGRGQVPSGSGEERGAGGGRRSLCFREREFGVVRD